MSAAKLRARWTALTGTGGAASLALALLVLGCVFVAVAGPRESLGFRTHALQSSLATAPPLVKSVVVSSGFTAFTVPFQGPITAGTLSGARRQLRSHLASIGLPLAPAAADWSSLTSAFADVSGAARGAFNGLFPPELEVIYRDALSGNARLAAGKFPRAGAGRRLNIAVSVATARRFGLHVGSRLISAAVARKVSLTVTGIIRPVHPGSAFWTADPVAATPAPPVPRGPQYWSGAAFADAAEVGPMQSDFDLFDGQLQWDFPLALGGINADQAGPLQSDLTRAGLRAGALSTPYGPVNVHVGSGLSNQLFTFVSTDAALAELLSLLFVSLTVIGLVVVLLGARMLAEYRRAEFGLMRARGAARRQLALLALTGGAVAALPAALAGTAIAVAATPRDPEPLAWWLAATTILVALAGPPLIALRWADTGEAAGARTLDQEPGRAARARRWVAEGAAVLLAGGGLVELRQQGLPQGGGTNFYISAAPVLVAVPAAVLVIRLSPFALRGLLRLAAARPGVTAFVGFARAARAALAATLPAFALVLALTVVAFGFMVRTAVLRGEIGASWRAVGADAVVSLVSAPDPITPAEQRAIAAVPGVSRAVPALVTTASLNGGPTISVISVSPVSYAAWWPARPIRRSGRRCSPSQRAGRLPGRQCRCLPRPPSRPGCRTAAPR
jgi:putative ABC transport system permease protein